jgi:two-component system sensor histidine kinase/response regulator
MYKRFNVFRGNWKAIPKGSGYSVPRRGKCLRLALLLKLQVLYLIFFSVSVSVASNLPVNSKHHIDRVYLADPNKAIQLSTALYAEALGERDNYTAAEALLSIAKFYYLQGDYNLAEDMATKGLTIYQKLNDARGITRALICSGDVLRKEKKYQQADRNYRAAQKIAEWWRTDLELCQAYNRIGDIYRHQNSLVLAEQHYMKSLSISKGKSFFIEIGNNYNNLGEVKRLQGKYAQSRDYYEKALLLARRMRNQFGIVENQHGLACIDTLRGNSEFALARLAEARKVAEHFHFREELKNVYALQAAIFEKKGDLAASLKIQKEFNELNERLYLASVTLQNTQQQTINEIEQKDRQLRDKNVTISKMSVLQVWLFIGLVMLLIGSIYLYNLNLQRKKDNKEIARQSLILEEASIQSEAQREELQQSNDIRNRLLGMVSHDIRTPMYNSMHLIELLLKQKDDVHRMKAISSDVLAGLRVTTQLIDNLLFWSKKNSSGISARFEIMNLAGCLAEEMNLLILLANVKSIVIENKIPPHLSVYADAQLLRMTIRNLVMNSIKFTPSGGTVCIEASRINGHSEVRITDSGIGI